jgi:hypothetical protein
VDGSERRGTASANLLHPRRLERTSWSAERDPLLGEGAAFGHRFERALATEIDEYEQRPARAERDARCSFDKRASSLAGSSRLLRTSESRLGDR